MIRYKKSKEESSPNKQPRISKKKRKNTSLPVEQIPSENTSPTGIDFVSPSLVKETLPEEHGVFGRYNDYLVEVGSTVEQARYYRSFFAEIKGGNTWASMLDPLILGEFGKGDTDVAIHVEPVDTTVELEEVKRRIQGLESDLMLEKNDSRAIDMRDEIADLKDRQRRLRTNIEKPFRVSIQAVVSSLDLKLLKKFTNNLVRRFAGREIYMRSPDGKQLDALFNITPFSQNFMYKEHTFSYETSNVADFFPFGHGGISHRSGIVLGSDDLGRPIYYDAWHPKLMNHNMVILGRSGGGKTFCTLTLTHRSAHLGIRTVIIDPKGDYRRFVTTMGCPYVDLAPDSQYRINFFDVDVEDREDGTDYVNIEETVQGVRAIVFKMIRVMDDTVLTGKIKVKIENAIRQLYRDAGINEDPKSLIDPNQQVITTEDGQKTYKLSGAYKEMPTLGDLYTSMTQEPELEEVAQLLRNFTRHGDSPTQAIFDTQSNVSIQDTPIFAFGLGLLDEEVMRPIGLFIATKWQSTKFAKKNRKLRKRVVFDEAQTAMYEPETAQWLEQEFRTVRFFNCSMTAVTQGFEVFTRVEQGMGILKNAPTKIFLKQEPIDIEEVKGKFDLTEGEGSFLVHQAEKGLGIIRVDDEASIIKIDSTPLEHELFTTDPNE
ncbi:VirB4 family type IV secretion system protein [Bacillus piscicola]|uniref:VirB4 family type IV secretion system protein n=1 Tax=Bacillus piscicola TaxID=1632684 RepID=UPI001F09DA10|nr:ATP-binding protein [Bacillus piscicola]